MLHVAHAVNGSEWHSGDSCNCVDISYPSCPSSLLCHSGKCSFPFDIDEDAEALEFKDFEVAELKIDDALKSVDPTDLPKVDETLLGLSDIDPAVVMAVSIAAARAGCRHKGVSLFKFLSDIAGTEPQIPVPVPSIVCRTVGAHREMKTQHVHLYPVKACSLDTALTTLMQTVNAVNKEIVEAKMSLTVSSSCCAQLSSATADEMLMVCFMLIHRIVTK
jgi:enolase